MKRRIFCMLVIALLVISGCIVEERTTQEDRKVQSSRVEIVSENRTFPAYLAAPSWEGRKPAVVLIHSFNGLEPGYLNLTDNLASEGYVVLSPEWQTFERTPRDEVMEQLIRDSVAYLHKRNDVSTERLGLTGFCAGGRYTMLFLPQVGEFRSGVAWYGFPYSGGFANQSKPADMIGLLEAPMLMIHGTHDAPSPISEIYRYAAELNASGRYFELKVYQGEPHGFMIKEGQLSEGSAAKDAYWQMVTFFNRTLKG